MESFVIDEKVFSADWLLRMHVAIFLLSFSVSLLRRRLCLESLHSHSHPMMHTLTQGAVFDWQSVTFGLFNFSFKVNAAPHGMHIRPLTGWWWEMAIACVYDHQKLVQGSGTQKLFQIQFGIVVIVIVVVVVVVYATSEKQIHVRHIKCRRARSHRN